MICGPINEDLEIKVTDAGKKRRPGSVLICALLIVLMNVLFVLPHYAGAATWTAEETLKAYLQDNYPWERIEVRNIRIEGTVPDIEPSAVIVERGPIGKAVFLLMFEDLEKITVRADVTAYESVVKSRRSFKKGYLMNEEDVYLTDQNVHKMPKNALQNPDLVIRRPLKRTVLAGSTLAEDMFEKKSIVEKGKKITLLIRGKGYTISALGETREKGVMGMPVRVINLSSKKELKGVLIDESTVDVEL